MFIPVASPLIDENEAKAVYNVVKSGWISMGKKVQEFEKLFCEYSNTKFALAMNNGTSTLHAIMMALDIKPGDEVIIPSLSYISLVNVVLYQGATPILCDSNQNTFNVCKENIKSKITNKTKAFVTVDMKGLPVDYEIFQDLSKDTGIPFISDSAESLGALYKGNAIGSQALVHSFSFFANKNVTTGEGGMIVTNDEKLFRKLSIIRNQGQEGRYNHTMIGNNFRMTDILAAIGIEQLKKIEKSIIDKNFFDQRYQKILSKISGIQTPFIPRYVDRHSWYLYSIMVDSMIRDDLVNFLKNNGIETRLSFPPVHIQPFYKNKYNFNVNDFPDSLTAYSKFIDIPIWSAMGKKRQDLVIENIKKFMSSI